MTRAGPVDELIAKTRDWRGAMLAKLRKIVRDADPEIAEDVKWKRPSNPLGSAVWSHDGQVCVGIILKGRARRSGALDDLRWRFSIRAAPRTSGSSPGTAAARRCERRARPGPPPSPS